MDESPNPAPTSMTARRRSWLAMAIGFAAALLLGLVIGEVYLRAFPPKDLNEYLGEASPLRGPFVASADGFRIRYPSYEALREANPDELGDKPSLADTDYSEHWAFFGTSFVHMKGALFDTVGEMAPDQPRFRLDRRETLLVRLAQIEALLDHGFKPGRIIMVIMPIDVGFLGEQSLDSVRVSQHGAQVFEPRMPGPPFDALVNNSRLAFTAWIRTGKHVTDPDYERDGLYSRVPPRIKDDFQYLFEMLGNLSAKHDVPVTMIFMPREDQGVGRAGYAFQDVMVPLAMDAGLDALDVRDVFLSHEDPQILYAPDGHLSKLGNQLVVNALFEHLGLPTVALSINDGGDEP